MKIRCLQPVDWGLLPPYPIALHDHVSSLVGQNGSGKSTALDAIKAALGTSRFGANRTPSAYLNSGRGEHPPAQEAFLLLCCEDSEQADDLPFSDPQGRFTILWWITRSRRVGLALPGHVLLGMGDRDLAADIAALKDRYPRRDWLRPEDMQARVLDLVGATQAVHRLLEVPQGQVHRLLDAPPDRLLRDLLGLMGALEPLEALAARRDEHARAREERDRAQRAVLQAELALAHAQRDLAPDGRADEVRRRIDDVRSRLAGAADSLAEQAAEQAGQARADAQQAQRDAQHAKAALADAQEAARQAAAAPGEIRDALAAARHLTEQGLRAEVAAAALQPGDATPAQASAARHLLCTVVVSDGDWDTALALAGAHPGVRFAKAGGRGGARAWWRRERPDPAALREHERHVEVDGRALVPLADIALPAREPDTEAVQEAQRAVWEADRRITDAGQRERAAAGVQQRARQALELADGAQPKPAGAAETDGLQAELRRLQADLARAEQSDRRRDERARLLEVQETELADARELLDGQDGALERAQQALTDARGVYRQHVQRLIAELGERFSQLCEAAGMRGELRLIDAPMTEAGGRLDVLVAETPQAPLRSYHQEADLSGGWRAKTATLVMLSALCAAGGRRTLPVCCLDEPAAALDEDRIAELGAVFRRLSREMGLQIVLATPTKRSAEKADWADVQIAFLKATHDAPYAPLPHIIEADPSAREAA